MDSEPSPFDILLSDHAVLRARLSRLAAIVDDASASLDDPVHRARAVQEIEVLLMGDAQHHAREEALLRALHRARPMLGDGPLATIRDEHRESARVREEILAMLGDPASTGGTIEARIRRMIDEMRSHLAREERHLFPFAREVLDGPALARALELMHALRSPTG